MAKYRIIFGDEEDLDLFDSEAEAEEYARYLVSCYHLGGEILHMSNPGDYDDDTDDDPDYKIVEVDD